MRIISGTFRGKKIIEPKDIKTRPLKDLTKESIFNILHHTNKFIINLKNSNVLDLFSGVGSFGIECLSRGVKNVEIKNIKAIKSDDSNYLFHAGTTQKDNKIYAIGGRVLNFVSLSDDFSESKNKVMQNLDKLNWSGGFYRKDIGYKVIE